jgi:polyhydroxyalkanoate synthesis regulator phasin
VVEHPRLLEDRLGGRERAVGIARQQHALGELGGRAQVDRAHGALERHGGQDSAAAVWETDRSMARRRTTPKELPDAVREAVERTVQATLGSAQQTRDRAQGAVDDLVEAVDDVIRGAESGLARSQRAVRDATRDRLPATREDLKELRSELRRIARRLDAIEKRLPAPRSRGSTSRPSTGRGG